MIKVELKVEDYCHKCPKFSTEMAHQYMYASGESIEKTHYVTITCEHEDLCSFLRREIEKDETVDELESKKIEDITDMRRKLFEYCISIDECHKCIFPGRSSCSFNTFSDYDIQTLYKRLMENEK